MLWINWSDLSNLANAREPVERIALMAEMTNLTDRLAHLRDRKTGSPIIQGDPDREQKPKIAKTKSGLARGRRLSNDYFVVFVYALLGAAVLTQFMLIAWLDLI